MDKKEKDEILAKYEFLKSQRSEYGRKAKVSGYKPEIPKMPENKSDYGLLKSTLSGFEKRFSNWKMNYTKFEQTRMEESYRYNL
jgi:hypothetical protein